jgi:hypothetical protein
MGVVDADTMMITTTVTIAVIIAMGTAVEAVTAAAEEACTLVV